MHSDPGKVHARFVPTRSICYQQILGSSRSKTNSTITLNCFPNKGAEVTNAIRLQVANVTEAGVKISTPCALQTNWNCLKAFENPNQCLGSW